MSSGVIGPTMGYIIGTRMGQIEAQADRYAAEIAALRGNVRKRQLESVYQKAYALAYGELTELIVQELWPEVYNQKARHFSEPKNRALRLEKFIELVDKHLEKTSSGWGPLGNHSKGRLRLSQQEKERIRNLDPKYFR